MQWGGSHVLMIEPDTNCNNALPTVSLVDGPKQAKVVHQAIRAGLIESAHDCSEGGLLVAAAEMAFGGSLGLELHVVGEVEFEAFCFGETPSRYLLEVSPKNLDEVMSILADVSHAPIGTLNETNQLTIGEFSWSLDDLRTTWMQGMVV